MKLVSNILKKEDIQTLKKLTYKNYLNKLRIQSKRIHQLLTELEYQVFGEKNIIVLFVTLIYSPETEWDKKNIKTTQNFLEYLQEKMMDFIKEEDFEFILYGIELHKNFKEQDKKLNIFDTNKAFIDEKDTLFGYPHLHFLLIKKNNIFDDQLNKSKKNKYIKKLYNYFDEFDINVQLIYQNIKKFYLKKKFIYILKEYRLNEDFYYEKYKLFIKNKDYLNILENINNYFKISVDYSDLLTTN